MTLKTDEAIKIAEGIKADIQKGDVGISQIIRLYYNLALLIGNDNEVMWASEELDGYKNYSDVPDYRRILVNNTRVFVLDDCDKLEYKSKGNYITSYEYPTCSAGKILVGVGSLRDIEAVPQ